MQMCDKHGDKWGRASWQEASAHEKAGRGSAAGMHSTVTFKVCTGQWWASSALHIRQPTTTFISNQLRLSSACKTSAPPAQPPLAKRMPAQPVTQP